MDSDNKPQKILATCPLGRANCPIFEQISQLQARVDQLSEAASKDSLTGLFNRQHLMLSLEQELERTRRSAVATTLILLDVDHFKQFNDNYGHTLGDKVLVHLGHCLRSAIRRLDIPCRYGGEEFAIVLPSSSIATGALVAERIRSDVESNGFKFKDKLLTITVSLGIAAYRSESCDSLESLIDAADQQLYAAKQAGRNCVRYAAEQSRQISVSAEEKAALFNFDSSKNSST